MKWTVEYSKRAGSFIEEHGIEARVRDSVRDFILRISGSSINIDIKKLKGEWTDYYRIRKELLGHKSPAMTMRYAHHYPESLRHEVEVLDGGGYVLVTVGKKQGAALPGSSPQVIDNKR